MTNNSSPATDKFDCAAFNCDKAFTEFNCDNEFNVLCDEVLNNCSGKNDVFDNVGLRPID